MNVTEVTMEILSGGQSPPTVISGTSAQTPVVTQAANTSPAQKMKCTFTPDADAFVRKGVNPTAVVGTDQFVMARNTYRCELAPGERLAFITSGATGNVYFTQEQV
jgi:hypothetical protein